MSWRSFSRHVVVLASGAIVAQAVPVLASPVLSRLFTPETFGLFAILTAIVTALSTSIAGRFDVAVVFPSRQRNALELCGLAFYTVSAISLFVLMLVYLYGEIILELMDAASLSEWIYSVPMLLFLSGVWNIGSYLANREQRYKLMSVSRIVKNSVMVAVQIICGVLGYQVGGLLVGFATGWLVGALLMVYQHKHHLSVRLIKFSSRKKLLASQYKRYPLYDAPATLLNSATAQIAYFILPLFFSGDIVGQFYMMQRVLYIPLSFLSLSVSQVNMNHVNRMLKNKERLDLYVIKMGLLLFVIAVLPMTVIYFFSDQLFVFVLGEQWSLAGHFAKILAPAIIVQFLAVSLSTTLYATKNLRVISIWKTLSFCSTLLVFMYYSPRGDMDILINALMINLTALYVIYFVVILIAARLSTFRTIIR